MYIAEKEYKIRLVLRYPQLIPFIAAPVYEDRLFSTYFECLDHLLDIRDAIKENGLAGLFSIVRVERPLPTEEFLTVCHIVEEVHKDWCVEAWFDENEDDMDYIREKEDNDCLEFFKCAVEAVGKKLEDMPEIGGLEIFGIKLAVNLNIYDTHEENLYSGTFMSFTELNEFLEMNRDKYKGNSMTFYLCEYNDGQTGSDGTYWSKEYGHISMRDISAAVNDEYEDIFLQFLNHRKPERIVVYRGESKYDKSQAEEDQTLVCDACFRPADECTCEKKALFTVPIDTKYLPIIRELNEKGYRTQYCCAGHERHLESVKLLPNLIFCYENNFTEPLPKEYVYFKNSCEIRLRDDEDVPDGSDIEEFRAYHEKITNDLAEWVHKLPTVAEIEYRERFNLSNK